MRNKIITIFLLLAVSVPCFAQVKRNLSKDCDDNPKFRYLIVSNQVAMNGHPSEKAREILVFMDEKGFSEENLKVLFTKLSKKYSYPSILDIRVETNWSRIPTPEECEGWGTSGEPDRGDEDDYHWAVYLRNGENEIFHYNPTLKDTLVKTVVIKGKAF